jgi:hypothetical protein
MPSKKQDNFVQFMPITYGTQAEWSVHEPQEITKKLTLQEERLKH